MGVHRGAAWFVAAALVACGGQTTGGVGGGGGSGGGGGASATASGSVGGVTFSVASAVAIEEAASTECTNGAGGQSQPDSGTCISNGQVIAIAITNRSDATCAVVQSEAASGTGYDFANLDEVLLAVVNDDGDVAAGTFPVTSAGSTASSGAAGEFMTNDASCAQTLDAPATSGTVTLTTLTATEVAGSYDLTFGSQGSISGSFDLTICVAQTGTITGGGGPPVCKP